VKSHGDHEGELPPRAEHDHGGGQGGLRFVEAGREPVVLARQASLSFAHDLSPDRVFAALAAFVEGAAQSLEVAGCILIGHIKGTLTTESGALTFHKTTATGPPVVSGALAGRPSQAKLSINAIVFGVTEECLRRSVEAAASSAFDAEIVWCHRGR
jgi:hypothetical protein